MTPDFTHLDALELGAAHERARLARARTPQERALRAVWLTQYERQIADERALLGLDAAGADMTDAELLAELSA